ncbi:MAG: four helix bundle protein [Minisyncoccales bacterium]
MKIKKFEELGIWQLSKDIYDLTLKKEFSRDFNLKGQIRRAIISVGSKKTKNSKFVNLLIR